MKRNIFLLIGLFIVFAFSACEDLEVENTNRPTFVETNDPSQVNGIVGGLFNSLQYASHTFDEPLLAWYNAADAGSCSWGNFGMRDISSEPRVAYNNTPAYPNRVPVENYYIRLYSYLSQANDALLAISNDVDTVVEEPERAKAVAYYTQAYCLGHVGMFFDKGFVVTENTDLSVDVPMVTYDVIIDSALRIVDKAIAICESSEFEIPTDWLPTNETYTEVEMGALANTLAARLLTYRSRNATQNAANDWDRIAAYAAKGIEIDYAPIMNDNNWYDYYRWYAIRAGWGRVDMRVINMMDPAMDPWFPPSGDIADLPNNGLATSNDDRLLSDFEYMDKQDFLEERGIYHYTTYRYKRYDNYRDTRIGALPCILVWENDMILAEALVRKSSPDLAGAAAILNDPAGPRKDRGGLADVPVDQTAILAAIYYEKTIECMLTTEVTEFYDMRRRDMLQEGTPLHLPIPAQQLQVMGLDFYTFGGTTGVAGEDYSEGGWETLPGFTRPVY